MKKSIIKEQLEKIFTEEFISDPKIVFDLLENLQEDNSKSYEKETYSDHMILTHEIDYELNKTAIEKIIKDQEQYNLRHDECFAGKALDERKLDISLLSDSYERLSSTRLHIHYDPDYKVYYDPELHDKSDWRN